MIISAVPLIFSLFPSFSSAGQSCDCCRGNSAPAYAHRGASLRPEHSEMTCSKNITQKWKKEIKSGNKPKKIIKNGLKPKTDNKNPIEPKKEI